MPTATIENASDVWKNLFDGNEVQNIITEEIVRKFVDCIIILLYSVYRIALVAGIAAINHYSSFDIPLYKRQTVLGFIQIAFLDYTIRSNASWAAPKAGRTTG